MQNFDIAIETAESFYETDRLGKDPEISDAFFAYSKYDNSVLNNSNQTIVYMNIYNIHIMKC